MSMLTHYSKDKEFAFYDDGSVSHRHKLNADDPANVQLGCKQAYYLCKDGKCTKCGQLIPKLKS